MPLISCSASESPDSFVNRLVKTPRTLRKVNKEERK